MTSDVPTLKAGRRGTWKSRLLALSVSVTLSLIVAEVVVRAFVGAPLTERLPLLRVQANEHRGWEMVPGEDHYTYHHPVTINELGLRGPEIAPRRDGEVRVLALGDSLTYGQGVADDQTLPHHLEQSLEAIDPKQRDWTVFNAGHRAYATNQELGLLQELGERIDPDVVILFWYWNDLKEPDIATVYRRLSYSGPITFDLNRVMTDELRREWQLKQLARRSALVMAIYDTFGGREDPGDPEEWRSEGLTNLDRRLQVFRNICANGGIDLVFAIIPDPNEIRGAFHTGGLAEDAIKAADRHGLPAVRLREPLRDIYRASGELPVIPHDGHYAPEGNQAMAETCARFLLEHGVGGE